MTFEQAETLIGLMQSLVDVAEALEPGLEALIVAGKALGEMVALACGFALTWWCLRFLQVERVM